MCLEILVGNLATNFQDLVAKVKNLVTLAAVLGAILHPVTDVQFEHFVTEYLKLDTQVIHKLFMSASMSSFAMFHSVFKATKGCFPSKNYFKTLMTE